MSKSIVVDLDGTVVDTYGMKFCQRAKQLCGKVIKSSALTDYNFANVTTLTEDNLAEIFSSKNFYRRLEPLPNAIESLQQLYAGGFQLHFITVRPSNTHVRAETLEWFVKHSVPFNSIHILTRAEGALGRARIAEAMKLNYFIDDTPLNAVELSRVGLQGFLVKTLYNQNTRLPKHTKFVADLSDVAKRLLT